MNVLCSATPCPVILNSTCVFYEGANLLYIGVNTNDSIQTALEKINYSLSNFSASDLQSVTDVGATTTNSITVQTLFPSTDPAISGISLSGEGVYGSSSETNGVHGFSQSGNGVYGESNDGSGVYGTSTNSAGVYGESSGTNAGVYGYNYTGVGVYGESDTGVGILGFSEIGNGASITSLTATPISTYGNGNNTPSIEVNLGNTNKGVVIESGTSSTGNPIEVKKNGVNKLTVNQQGEVTSTKLIKEGGTGTNLLLDDGNTVSLSSINSALSTGVRVTHTGTTVNTVLATLTIPANWISEFGIYHVIVGASRGSNNFSSPATINVDFSGTDLNDDFIRGVNIGNVSNAKTNILRTIIFRNGNREMFSNSGNFYSDLGSLQQNETIPFDRTLENTLQVSITLTNSSDIAYFDYLSIVKVSQ